MLIWQSSLWTILRRRKLVTSTTPRTAFFRCWHLVSIHWSSICNLYHWRTSTLSGSPLRISHHCVPICGEVRTNLRWGPCQCSYSVQGTILVMRSVPLTWQCAAPSTHRSIRSCRWYCTLSEERLNWTRTMAWTLAQAGMHWWEIRKGKAQGIEMCIMKLKIHVYSPNVNAWRRLPEMSGFVICRFVNKEQKLRPVSLLVLAKDLQKNSDVLSKHVRKSMPIRAFLHAHVMVKRMWDSPPVPHEDFIVLAKACASMQQVIKKLHLTTNLWSTTNKDSFPMTL